MKREGIDVVTTKVGDRYVLEQMRALGACIGGEQSGHIIFLEHNSTGDGLVTALQLLSVIATTGKPVSELMQVMDKFPQALVNVRVADKALYVGNGAIAAAEQRASAELGDEGRLLVRPSGTEPLIRVDGRGTHAGTGRPDRPARRGRRRGRDRRLGPSLAAF